MLATGCRHGHPPKGRLWITSFAYEKQLTVQSVDVRELIPIRLGAVKGSFSEQRARNVAAEFTVYESVEDALDALLDEQIEGFPILSFRPYGNVTNKYNSKFR